MSTQVDGETTSRPDRTVFEPRDGRPHHRALWAERSPELVAMRWSGGRYRVGRGGLRPARRRHHGRVDLRPGSHALRVRSNRLMRGDLVSEAVSLGQICVLGDTVGDTLSLDAGALLIGHVHAREEVWRSPRATFWSNFE